MKAPLAAAFLSMALLASASAQEWNEKTQSIEYKDSEGNVVNPPSSDKPAAPGEKPATEAAPGGDAKYGSFALDASGNKITGEALSKLPPEAQWAMKEKGYSPVIGPNGEVLGYDNGSMCILPDAVGREFGLANPKPGPDGNLPAPAGGSAVNVQDMMATLGLKGKDPKDGMLPPPNTPKEGEDFCSANPGRPPCAAVKEPTPEEVAANDVKAADERMSKASQEGDVDATAKAIDDRREAQARADSKNPLGSPGTGESSTGPGPSPIASSGGQNMGPEGRVGGDKGGTPGGGLDGREVQADSRALAQSLIDMNKGMANGPLDGDSDPNVQSVAQVAQRGLGGRALDAARSLFGSLTENLGAQADAPETDLSDQLATSPVDGATANRAAIKVVECRRDTLDGTSGGRSSRRVGGC